MNTIALIFPHQLFARHPVLREKPEKVLLLEDSLFFGDAAYPLQMHKQKLAYHRATMSHFAETLEKKGHIVQIVSYQQPKSGLGNLCKQLAKNKTSTVCVVQLHDFMLHKRLARACQCAGLNLQVLPSPAFINSDQENRQWRATRKRWAMSDFYSWQRKRLNIMMVDGKPEGGRWSFDEDNRKKLPKAEIAQLPAIPSVNRNKHIDAAIKSVELQFEHHPGSLEHWYYPTTHRAADSWLTKFLEERFDKFGPYEDAIAAGHNWIYHSVLTPMLNIGLLTPDQVVRQALAIAQKRAVPVNSVEGFIRQIIGWREFMRATYDDLGVAMRTSNHWQHTRPLPQSFYTATTGIDPVDDCISRVLQTGYCHHIERLMILGGFLFLCEVEPDDIYRWFMEMFVDSYDWVMVPNVYAMSQHADGGAITTKPYFSGSNYVLKMSNFKRGEWSVIWDALFWRWIIKNSDQLTGNPRWAMMVRNAQKMDKTKQAAHLEIAEKYLAGLA